LLHNEGKVGTFHFLSTKVGRRGDNLTPHHLPSDAFMQAKVPGYTRDQGIAMMMEAPPVFGRHRLTASYGSGPDLSLTPRQALAREIRDLRRIYMAQGLYLCEIHQALLEVIRQNRTAWPGQF
jgi:hypothetical protein